jgi:hypothetical protein
MHGNNGNRSAPQGRATFAQMQPAYAAHRIALIPCEFGRKKPLVKHPQLFGCPGAAKLAAKPEFADASAYGYCAGPPSGIAVADADSTDERVLADFMDRHGATPLITRSASRKFHGLYRYNGERRCIRPWKAQGLPIDLLGAGLVIAPPSVTANGSYEIIQGSLDDLDRLPVMRGLDATLYRSYRPPSPPPRPSSPKPWAEMRRGSGRNNELFRKLGRDARHCDGFDQLLNCARTLNEGFAEPLADGEVMTIAQSIWRYQVERRNRFGQRGAWLPDADVDAFEDDAIAGWLLVWLKRHNGPDATFFVADGLADRLKLPHRKFAEARRRLIDTDHIVCIRKCRRGHPALYRWVAAARTAAAANFFEGGLGGEDKPHE